MMADSNDTKPTDDTTVKNEDGKLTVPKTDGETSTNKENKSALEPTQNEEKRELSDFEQAAEEGRKTAEANLAAEEKENGDAEPGAENVTAKVTTSEAQPQLKPADEKGNVTAKKVDERIGDDKAAQKADYGLKVGRETAKANLETEKSDQPEGQSDKMSFEDAVEEGRKTAERNHKAEVAANKAANAR